jgi:hypothetical protein
MELGERAGSKAPGKLGEWLRKPFEGGPGDREERREGPGRTRQDRAVARVLCEGAP